MPNQIDRWLRSPNSNALILANLSSNKLTPPRKPTKQEWTLLVLKYVEQQLAKGKPVFTCFEKHPQEIRLMIFKFMMPASDMVSLCDHDCNMEKIKLRGFRPSLVPLQICFEGRQEVLKRYKLFTQLLPSGSLSIDKPKISLYTKQEKWVFKALEQLTLNLPVVSSTIFWGCMPKYIKVAPVLEDLHKRAPELLTSITKMMVTSQDSIFATRPHQTQANVDRESRDLLRYFPNLAEVTLDYVSNGNTFLCHWKKSSQRQADKTWYLDLFRDLHSENPEFKIPKITQYALRDL